MTLRLDYRTLIEPVTERARALYLGAIPSIFPFLSEKLDRSLYVQQVSVVSTFGTP